MESNQDRADAHRREQEDYGVFAESVFADPKWHPKPGPTKKQVGTERRRHAEERRRLLIEAGVQDPGPNPGMIDAMWSHWRRKGSPRSLDLTVELMPDMLDRLHEVARGSDATREEIVRLALAEFLGVESTSEAPPAQPGTGPRLIAQFRGRRDT